MQNALKSDDARTTVLKLMAAVIESVDAVDGAPGGILYAALMEWLPLDRFETLMHGLTHAGALVKRGELYYATPLGREFVMALDSKLAPSQVN